MASIIKRKTKHGVTYFVAYYVDGHLVRKRVGKTLRLAEIVLGETAAKLERKDADLLPKDRNIQQFFAEYFARTRHEHAPSYQLRLAEIKKNLERFINEKRPRATKLSHITLDFAEDYMNWRLGFRIGKSQKKPIKKRTVNLELVVLKSMLNKAVQWDCLSSNPLVRLKLLKVDDAKVRRPLTQGEVARVLEECPEWFYPIVYTVLYTGMREGEVRFLQWADVDFENNLIRIRAKEGWLPKSTGQKVRERAIPMTSVLADFLAKHRMKTLSKPEGWVFHGPDGRQLNVGLGKFLQRITKKIGAPEVTQFHALRDTFATHLIRSGADLVTAKDVLGHVDIHTTMRYAKPVDSHKRAMMERLNFNEDPRAKDDGEDPKNGAAGA